MALVKLNARSAAALDATVLTGNLPAISGASLTGLTAVNTPSFLCYRTSNQTINNSTVTHVQFDGEFYDTGGCYNNTSGTVTLNGVSAPAYSFAPNVAGKYFIGMKARCDTSTDGTATQVLLGKNNQHFTRVRFTLDNSEGMFCGGVIDLDGVDDFVKGYVSQNSGSGTVTNGGSTWGEDSTIAHMFGFKLIGA